MINSLSDDQKRALSIYASDVMEWNESFNLTGASDLSEFETFHINDSLLPIEIIKNYIEEALKSKSELTLADLGCGAGLPLIPLSIALADYPVSFYGIERSHKRCVFLKMCISKLKTIIPINISVIEKDIDEVKDEFDIIVFRAFRTIGDVEKGISRILKSDGTVFAYKGEMNKTEKELLGLKYFNGEVLKLDKLDDRERTLMVLKKLK